MKNIFKPILFLSFFIISSCQGLSGAVRVHKGLSFIDTKDNVFVNPGYYQASISTSSRKVVLKIEEGKETKKALFKLPKDSFDPDQPGVTFFNHRQIDQNYDLEINLKISERDTQDLYKFEECRITKEKKGIQRISYKKHSKIKDFNIRLFERGTRKEVALFNGMLIDEKEKTIKREECN